jgi:cystathionine beta-lyase family protein involved in aluminum resistance
MFDNLEIKQEIIDLAGQAEEDLKSIYKKYENNTMINSIKVFKAFQNAGVSTSDFNEVTGYGYSDIGRDKLEKIYAEVFKAEDAIVRPQIMCGTHALSVTLFGLLKYGDTLLSISGDPYDTLKSVIGTVGDSKNSLIAHGVKYEQIELIDSHFDIPKIVERVSKQDVRLVEIQRSRGYSERLSLSIDKIEKVINEIKRVAPNTIVLVDNCYGEFVETREPIEVGADVIISSLMKNLGAGIATSGGYIVGKKDLIWQIAETLNCPVVGKEMGANFNQLLSYYKGLFMAPKVVESALKTMTFASYMLQKLGFDVSPKYDEERTDIIQTIKLNTKENLIGFCEGIQSASPVESYVTPVPEQTPGYPHEEIMAGGSFTPGSTIELSADGPLVEPYTAYMQGGLTYEYGKLGIMTALSRINKN